jgi:hypothetical protein
MKPNSLNAQEDDTKVSTDILGPKSQNHISDKNSFNDKYLGMDSIVEGEGMINYIAFNMPINLLLTDM